MRRRDSPMFMPERAFNNRVTKIIQNNLFTL